MADQQHGNVFMNSNTLAVRLYRWKDLHNLRLFYCFNAWDLHYPSSHKNSQTQKYIWFTCINDIYLFITLLIHKNVFRQTFMHTHPGGNKNNKVPIARKEVQMFNDTQRFDFWKRLCDRKHTSEQCVQFFINWVQLYILFFYLLYYQHASRRSRSPQTMRKAPHVVYICSTITLLFYFILLQ